MKKIAFILLFLLDAICLVAGELIPLQQYNSHNQINRIPDRYLFQAIGILTALDFSKTDENIFLSKFNKLPIVEQYHVAYVLSMLCYDERMSEFFIPAYNSVRWRIKENDFKDNFDRQFFTIWTIFLQNLKSDFGKTSDFYNYARRVAASYKDDISEEEQLYIATMLSLASQQKLMHSECGSKDDIINFVINVIDKSKSNRVKTKLTYDFIHFMDINQLEKLNTTEYSLLLALPKVLYNGRFLDFSEIYYKLIHSQKKYISSEEIMDELHTYFPNEKWESPLEAVEFIYKNRKSFMFDDNNRKYICK